MCASPAENRRLGHFYERVGGFKASWRRTFRVVDLVVERQPLPSPSAGDVVECYSTARDDLAAISVRVCHTESFGSSERLLLCAATERFRILSAVPKNQCHELLTSTMSVRIRRAIPEGASAS